MDSDEDQYSPGWGASLFIQTTEDVARAVVAAAAAATAATAARSPRPSVVFSSKEDSGGPLRKFQRQVSRVLKGLSHPPEETRRTYNPEVLTSQKRQWASFQLQYLDHRILKEPSRLFESMVVVGLHPDCDIQTLQRQYFGRKSEGSGRFRNALGGQYHSRVEPNLEPQVLFVYPPDKELPLKYKDLLSFCFPGGLEVHAVEKTPSMSELNEILLGQEHLKQSDMSFVFRLQVADDSTLYGCCVLVDEMVQKPSRLISMISDRQPFRSPLSRYNLTTRRCYCILSRLPFFDLHFGVLNSIFTEERLEWLTKSIHDLDFDSSFENDKEECIEENTGSTSIELEACHLPNGTTETAYLSSNDSVTGRAIDDGLTNRLVETAEGSTNESVGGKGIDNDLPRIIEDASQVSTDVSVSGRAISDDTSHVGHQFLQADSVSSVKVNDVTVVQMKPEIGKLSTKEESLVATDSSKAYDTSVDDIARNKTAYSDHQSMNDSVTERAINDHLPNGTADIAQLTMNGSVIGRAVDDGLPNRTGVTTQLSTGNSVFGRAINEETSHVQYRSLQADSLSSDEGVNHDAVIPIDPETEKLSTKNEFAVSTHSSNGCDTSVDDIATIGKVVINRGVETDQLSTKDSDSGNVIDRDFPNGTPEIAQPAMNNSVTGRAIDDHFTNKTSEAAQLSINDSISGRAVDDNATQAEHQFLQVGSRWLEKDVNNDAIVPTDAESEKLSTKNETLVSANSSKPCDTTADDLVANRQQTPMQIPSAILPLLRYQHYESSDSSSSFQGSPSEDRNFRSDLDSGETEEASSSGQEDSTGHSEILEWAKANNLGSLQIICEYYQLSLPARGSTIKFHPLDHLHPLEFHRPDETIDLSSCHTSLELAEAHSALVAEEEATALSVWAVATICGSLRLEHVLTIFAAALLEKQIVFVCSNLGILSASVLSIIPLIRPYQWQSLLMPVLPNDMLDFLDAPVPYVVGVKNKTSEVQSKSSNVILVDANKNQVKTSTIPHLPQHKELYSALSSYHAQLVGESYLGRKRPIYHCTEVQVEAAKGFLGVLRSYLDSLCSNLRSHTITNVQSNDDKVSLLLKESFIESFPSRDRAFMKLFVDTQLFSVHTDRVLSFFQKD